MLYLEYIPIRQLFSCKNENFPKVNLPSRIRRRYEALFEAFEPPNTLISTTKIVPTTGAVEIAEVEHFDGESSAVFDEALHSIMRLMTTDSLRRFKKNQNNRRLWNESQIQHQFMT